MWPTLRGRFNYGHAIRIVQAGVDVQRCGREYVCKLRWPQKLLLNNGICRSRPQPPLQAICIFTCRKTLSALVFSDRQAGRVLSFACLAPQNLNSEAAMMGHAADKEVCPYAKASMRSAGGSLTCSGCAQQRRQAEAGQCAARLKLLHQGYKAFRLLLWGQPDAAYQQPPGVLATCIAVNIITAILPRK